LACDEPSADATASATAFTSVVIAVKVVVVVVVVVVGTADMFASAASASDDVVVADDATTESRQPLPAPSLPLSVPITVSGNNKETLLVPSRSPPRLHASLYATLACLTNAAVAGRSDASECIMSRITACSPRGTATHTMLL
jgi:hypothetical protein